MHPWHDKALEHKQVVVEDLLGPADALRILTGSLDLYRQLRRGELGTGPGTRQA
jgi:hypothetical protein